MVDAGEGCIGWGARDRDLMRGTVARCWTGLVLSLGVIFCPPPTVVSNANSSTHYLLMLSSDTIFRIRGP